MTEEKKTAIEAMILKNAFINAPGRMNQPAIITADSEYVFFAYPDDMRVGLKMKIEEWNRVVEFVDSQIIDKSEKGWNVDWSKIDANYKYVAADRNGYVFAYREEPYWDDFYGKWFSKNDLSDFFDLESFNNTCSVPPEESLIKRPSA